MKKIVLCALLGVGLAQAAYLPPSTNGSKTYPGETTSSYTVTQGKAIPDVKPGDIISSDGVNGMNQIIRYVNALVWGWSRNGSIISYDNGIAEGAKITVNYPIVFQSGSTIGVLSGTSIVNDSGIQGPAYNIAKLTTVGLTFSSIVDSYVVTTADVKDSNIKNRHLVSASQGDTDLISDIDVNLYGGVTSALLRASGNTCSTIGGKLVCPGLTCPVGYVIDGINKNGTVSCYSVWCDEDYSNCYQSGITNN